MRRPSARLDELGYGSLWSGEGLAGKEAFSNQGILLAATRSLVVGTGIANIWARRPASMAAGAATLAEAYPGRFVLGVGVSHRRLVEGIGESYALPVERMRGYLEEMDAAVPPGAFPRVLAALRPRMLELARDHADGAHPFLVPVEHAARAREILGPDKLLVPHLTVILEPDPARARAVYRGGFGATGSRTSVYADNLRSLGYTDSDLADGHSDHLMDALAAWGDESAIAKRGTEHLDAGADHVLVHPLTTERATVDPRPEDLTASLKVLERLAPALLTP